MDLTNEECYFFKIIKEQQKIYNEIQLSIENNIEKIEILINSIINGVKNDHEYIWYFVNNQFINSFQLDCFHLILNSYFILDQKVFILNI
jgi:hypothetical protein